MSNLTVNGGIHLREIGKEAVLYDTWNKKIHVLNRTASFVWKECRDGAAVEEIARHLTEHFEVQYDHALNDVRQVIRHFESLKLINQA